MLEAFPVLQVCTQYMLRRVHGLRGNLSVSFVVEVQQGYVVSYRYWWMQQGCHVRNLIWPGYRNSIRQILRVHLFSLFWCHKSHPFIHPRVPADADEEKESSFRSVTILVALSRCCSTGLWTPQIPLESRDSVLQFLIWGCLRGTIQRYRAKAKRKFISSVKLAGKDLL